MGHYIISTEVVKEGYKAVAFDILSCMGTPIEGVIDANEQAAINKAIQHMTENYNSIEINRETLF
ncbi:MAG: hypothetical protein NVSMB70_13910 [Chamaesiphon sp.]